MSVCGPLCFAYCCYMVVAPLVVIFVTHPVTVLFCTVRYWIYLCLFKSTTDWYSAVNYCSNKNTGWRYARFCSSWISRCAQLCYTKRLRNSTGYIYIYIYIYIHTMRCGIGQFGNKALRLMSGCRKREVTGEWREFCKHSLIGTTWPIPLEKGRGAWVLGILIYKGVKLESRGRWVWTSP